MWNSTCAINCNFLSMQARENKMRNIFLAGVILVSGCQTIDPLEAYQPVIDPKLTDLSKFQLDLVDCREIALKLHDEYKERQGKELVANLLVGAIAGATTGAVVGSGSSNQSTLIKAGAATGAAAGFVNRDYHRDIVKYGPRRVVDRCMTNRGHGVLNDIGRGT